MNFFGTLFKNKMSRVWFIVSASIIVFMIVVNILLTGVLYGVVSIVLGRERAIYKEGGVQAAYVTETESKKAALEKANKINEELCEEGFTLLKNENALPLSPGAKVSVFGKNSVNLVYGGSGSGGGDNTNAKKIFDSLTEAGISFNPALQEFYKSETASGAARPSNPSDLDSGGNVMLSTAETPYESYTDSVISSYSSYSDAAIVVISRIGGEGFDLPRTSKDDAERHYLELDPNEKALLTNVCKAGFKHVILVVNSSSVMELGFLDDGSYDGKIDACLWIGGPGNSGIMALGRILTGEVNPSGRTVDTWARDFTKDPTWNNFGDSRVDKGDQYTINGASSLYYFVDYEESIYSGYRYYETRGAESVVGGEGETWYKENVVFPLGYGLSYTSFKWEIENVSALENVSVEKDKTYNVSVKVTNAGSVAGKDVVQLYASAPYTSGETEKPYEVLCGFAKTELLQPGKSQIVTIEFDPYVVASYDYSDANSNGHKGYELDKGDYLLFVSRNAHDVEFTVPFNVNADILYDNATNRFENADDQLYNGVLSRADWTGTWPQTRTAEERNADSEFEAAIKNTESNNPNTYSEIPTTDAVYWEDVKQEDGSVTEEMVAYKLQELVGLSHDDEAWDKFLDQLSVKEMANLISEGAFHTIGILRLGVPQTTDADGPVGFCNFMGDPTVYDTCAYASEAIIAASWNVELLEDFGESLGEEGLWGNQKGDGMPYSGIYAPGANIHRSQFGGRNFEYYSEDGFLSGMLAAAQITGAANKGVYCFMKHFALNEQETHRSVNGVCIWADEQTIREVYLKPFEYAIRKCNADAEKNNSNVSAFKGIMSSFNRIGTVWTGGDYRLLSEVLRNEWGFKGTVIADFNTNSYMNPKQMAYAGGDLNLASQPSRMWSAAQSATSAADISVLRNCAHNILYTVANSNALNGEIVGYSLATWVIVLIIIDCALFVGICVWGFFAIRSVLKNKQ